MAWHGSEHNLSLKGNTASAFVYRELETPTLEELHELYSALPPSVLTPFQTPQFLHALQETHCRSGDVSLSVIRFSEASGNGAPAILLPLVRYWRGPLRVITTPDFGMADQNAPVISAVAPALRSELPKAIEAYFDTRDDADLVDINKLHPHVGEVANPLYSLCDTSVAGKTLVLDLQGNRETADWRRKSVYKKVRSKFRKLCEMGVDFVQASTPEERLCLFETLAEQRKERFQRLGREDSLQRNDRSAFYRCLAALRTTDTPFVALALKCGQEIVAVMVLLRFEDQATGVLVSIGDEKWHAFSPGMVLFSKAIDWASANGVRWFAFGTGEQDYKQRFGGKPQETRRLLKPLNARGRLFVRARDAQCIAQELLQIATRRNKLASDG